MRVIALSGTRNLRDLGGYATVDGVRTRWRTLYRSDCLDKIDGAGQAWLVDAGLRTIIDLRDDVEVERSPNVFATSASVAHRRVPIWNEPPADNAEPDLFDGYRRELDLRGHRLVAVFDELTSHEALPALIHCAAGKDRTGLVVGLVLAAVGVPAETIAEDYALSGPCLGPEYVEESRRMVTSQGLSWEKWAHLFETPPERMLKTLAYLDERYGGVSSFLSQHGVGAEQVEALHERLTEPVS